MDYLEANEINIECSLNNLIYLKFMVEKQINAQDNVIDKTAKFIVLFISDNPDIYNIFTIYNNNIKLNCDEFYSKHKELLKQIHVLLLVTCDHCWINDVDTAFSSYNICYCSNCHIRKRVW